MVQKNVTLKSNIIDDFWLMFYSLLLFTVTFMDTWVCDLVGYLRGCIKYVFNSSLSKDDLIDGR